MPAPAPETAVPPPGPGASANRWVPAALAVVAGFTDVQCFLGLAQTFAAFMTGTLISLGAELADPTPGLPIKAAMIATFVLAIAAASRVLVRLRRRVDDEAVVRRFVFAEAGLLAAMLLLGSLLAPFPAVGSWQMIVTGMAAVAAMSVQNVLMVHVLGFHPATTVMTLNLTHLIGHALGVRPPPPRPGAPTRGTAAEARRYASTVGPFLAGVAAGALGYRWLGFPSLVVPVAILLLLGAWLARRRPPA